MDMIITLSPQRDDAAITMERLGDALIVNGITLDLNGVAEGQTLERAAFDFPWLASDVTRIGGILHLAIRLPHGPDAPPETLFPAPIHVTNDGPVDLPPFG
jgi:hypothetical protein